MNAVNKDVYFLTQHGQRCPDKPALQEALQGFENASTPWYYTDCSGQLLGMNHHFCQWVGLSEKAATTATLDMFYTDDARKTILASQQRVITNYSATSMQETLKHTNNKLLPTQVTQIPLCDKQQRVIAVMHLCHPLQHLQDIAETIPAPFYWVDLDHRLLGANTLAMQAMGAKADDPPLIGKTAADIYPQDMADTLMKNQSHVVKTNKPLTILETIKDIHTGEIRHYKATLSPLHDNNKKIVGTYGISIDITHEKETQQLEGRGKVFQHLKNIAETIPVPFYWVDLNHRILGVNNLAMKTMGLTCDMNKIIGKTSHDVYSKAIADGIVNNQNKVIKSNKSLTAVEMIKDMTTGKTKYHESTIAPLHDDDGNIIGTYGISINITAQKEAEQLRLTQQKRFIVFISKAVHDIGSPLAVLKMLLHTLITLISQFSHFHVHFAFQIMR